MSNLKILFNDRNIYVKSRFIPLLLDLFPNSAVAYSLRKLKSTTTNVIKVRRTLNNLEQDFTAEQIINGTLTTFCGSGDGFVTTWYDQSGNNSHAIQNNASNQPKIVNLGVLVTTNNKPSVSFNGTNNNFSITNVNSSAPSDLSSFAVRSFSNYPSNFRALYEFRNTGLVYNSNGGTSYGAALIKYGSNTTKSDTYPTTTGQALDFRYNLSNLDRNNTELTLLNGGGFTQTTLSFLGSFNASIFFFQGNIQEVIFYESDKRTDKVAIKSNINNHYIIY
jgi:hypothetical protein